MVGKLRMLDHMHPAATYPRVHILVVPVRAEIPLSDARVRSVPLVRDERANVLLVVADVGCVTALAAVADNCPAVGHYDEARILHRAVPLARDAAMALGCEVVHQVVFPRAVN